MKYSWLAMTPSLWHVAYSIVFHGLYQQWFIVDNKISRLCQQRAQAYWVNIAFGEHETVLWLLPAFWGDVIVQESPSACCGWVSYLVICKHKKEYEPTWHRMSLLNPGHFACILVSYLVICKHRKEYGYTWHTKCPYWALVSVTNTKRKLVQELTAGKF